jgi:predicted MFS family arabinose efflux permease
MKDNIQSQDTAVRSSILLAPIVAASLLLLPIYVGGLITYNGLSLSNALSIVSLEMWGMALSLLPAVILMKRLSWRSVTFASMLLMILAFLISASMSLPFEVLAIIRFIGGVGAGVAMAVIMATIGKAPNPDKAFSLWVLSQVLFKVLGIFIVSRLLATFGMTGFYIMLLALCVLALPLVKSLPKVVVEEQNNHKLNWSIQPMLALVGVFTFYVAISAIWASFERIGHWSGFDAITIANILSFTSLASLAGASAATVFAGRIRRVYLLAAGLVLIACATFALGLFSTITVYSLIGLVFAFAWFFSVPFLIASVNSNDKSGRLMVFTNSAIAVGLALGPVIAATLVVDMDYSLLTISGAMVFVGTLFLLLLSNRKGNV